MGIEVGDMWGVKPGRTETYFREMMGSTGNTAVKSDIRKLGSTDGS